jgi:hypothetical protein
MLNFLDFNKKKEKKDYEIVTSRSGLPMFVIEPPDSLNNLTQDDDDREVEVITDLEIGIEIDEPVKKERSIPQQVSDYITRHF